MKVNRFSKMSLLNRIIGFLLAFGAMILLQITISRYQTTHVLEPLEERTESIQSISQFLNDVEGSMTALDNYRWDFGDTDALVETLRQQQKGSDAHLKQIDRDLGVVSEEQYLLANAAATTYGTFSVTVEEIIGLLQADRSDEASDLYYEKAVPCGDYLRQYTQQLLERAIRDNQSTYVNLNRLNGKLKEAQTIVLILCLVLGIILIISLLALLSSVKDMARASREISLGNFDTPDVDETLQDEIGQMARAFNEMKRSMKQQVRLLEERNQMQQQLLRKENEALEYQTLIEREKLQQLRSQINPHFLFNTLNVIMYSAQQEKAARTQSLIGSLSRLFRYALGSNEAKVPLSREIHIVDEFYSLYRARFGERMKLKWFLSPEVELTETMVPSFILQPLVENAFKHGLGPKEEGGCVEVYVDVETGALKICVRDDGVGMNQEDLTRLRRNLRNPPDTGEHIGMYNVAARLRLSGEGYGMEIRSREGQGTEVVLRLPLVRLWDEEEEQDDQDSDRG